MIKDSLLPSINKEETNLLHIRETVTHLMVTNRAEMETLEWALN